MQRLQSTRQMAGDARPPLRVAVLMELHSSSPKRFALCALSMKESPRFWECGGVFTSSREGCKTLLSTHSSSGTGASSLLPAGRCPAQFQGR